MPAAWTTPRNWTAGELVTAAIGNSAWRDNLLYLKDSPTFDQNVTVTGTTLLTGVATFTAAPVFSSATASQAVFTNGSKALVSNAITGTGNVVMSASPTLTGTIAGAAMTLSSTLGVTGVTTLTGGLSTALTVPNGGTGVATQQAYGVLVGGTTATGAMQSITPGTSTKVLTSAGTGALPTWSQPSNLTQSFRGLTVRTSPNADVAATTVTLDHADEIVMQDGVSVSDWNDLTANIAVSGAGGLDTGAEGASRWYSIHAISKSSDGTKNLLLHRAKNYAVDSSNTTDSGSIGLLTSAARTRLAQTFTQVATGVVPFVDLFHFKTLSAVGYLYVDLYATSGGLPTGAALATARVLDESLISTSSQWLRWVFDSPITLTAASVYALVLRSSTGVDATNYINWRHSTTSAYAGGQSCQYDGATWTAISAGYDFEFKVYVTQNDTALTMPSGYDQYALVGWVYNNSSSNFLAMRAVDREVSVGGATLGTFSTTLSTLTDLSVIVPPVPVVAKIMASISGATDSSLSVMPDLYYDLAGTDPRNLLTLPTSNRFYGAMYLGLTMEQAAYFLNNNGSGTISAYCTGFRW